MNFEDIISFKQEPLYLDINDSVQLGGEFDVVLHKLSNMLIYEYFPFVAALSLKHIDDELEESLKMKIQTLEKLKKKYNKRSKNVNIVQDIIIDDFEMYIDDNVQLIPNSHASLMKTTTENILIPIVIKQFSSAKEGKNIEKEFQNIYKLLNESCNNKFTKISFSNANQEILDEHMIYRIAQVWQIFQQFFKQFDYLDYLYNYYNINKINNTAEILNIIRILLEIGRINVC